MDGLTADFGDLASTCSHLYLSTPQVPSYICKQRRFSLVIFPHSAHIYSLVTLSKVLIPSAAMIPLTALTGLSNTLIFHFTVATTSSILMVLFAAFWTLLISKSYLGLKA
jgi:hypothetical protein